MRTRLKKSQKVTTIEFDEASPMITVCTYNTDLKKRLTAYAGRWPECCKLVDDDACGCLTFKVEKGRFCFRLTAPYSEERREAARRAASPPKRK